MISQISSENSKSGMTADPQEGELRGTDLSRLSIKEIWLLITVPQFWALLISMGTIMTIVFYAGSYYGATELQPNITLLEAKVEFLEKTQYDNSLKMIEAQKQLMLNERDSFDRKIAALKKSVQFEQARVRDLEKRLTEVPSNQEALKNNEGK